MSARLSRIFVKIEDWFADNRPVRAKTANKQALRAAQLAERAAENRTGCERVSYLAVRSSTDWTL